MKLVKKLNALAAGEVGGLTVKDVINVLEQSVETLEEASDEMDDALDYAIEGALNYAINHFSEFEVLKTRIEEYWLNIDYIPGGTPYEVIPIAAEFIAKWHRVKKSPIGIIKSLACSENWRERLVAAWYIRDFRGKSLEKEKKLLKKDPFTDDNDFYLVREALQKPK